MTTADLEVVSILARDTAKDRLKRSSIDSVEASKWVSCKSYTSIVQKQVSAGPSGLHATVSIAIFFGFCCSREPVAFLCF